MGLFGSFVGALCEHKSFFVFGWVLLGALFLYSLCNRVAPLCTFNIYNITYKRKNDFTIATFTNSSNWR